MTLSSDIIERLPHVGGVLNYLAPMAEKPMNLAYDPPPGVPRSNGVPEPHVMAIHDARAVMGRLSLGRIAGGVDRAPGTPRQPVTSVHNDYTVKSGPQRVRDLMGEEAEELLRHRFEIVNVWRPIRGPLRDAPLAICDATSVAFADFVPSDLVYRDRKGETYRVRYNPAHRWFYVPEMRTDEAVLIKCYDSAEDGTVRFTAHSAFEDPTAPSDVLPRESIELRTLLFHNA